MKRTVAFMIAGLIAAIAGLAIVGEKTMDFAENANCRTYDPARFKGFYAQGAARRVLSPAPATMITLEPILLHSLTEPHLLVIDPVLEAYAIADAVAYKGTFERSIRLALPVTESGTDDDLIAYPRFELYLPERDMICLWQGEEGIDLVPGGPRRFRFELLTYRRTDIMSAYRIKVLDE